MASLPEGWEFDYDGHRWFYRYQPSGVVQYHFPKPGDEFPEFIDAFSPPPSLAPEEKLESQQQVKRRSTTGESTSKSRGGRHDGTSGATLFESDEATGSGSWFQPDSLMYLGPGGYSDISPEQDEEYGPGDTDRSRSGQSPAITRADRLNISPLTSSQGTPQVPSSQPMTLANTPVTVHQDLSRPGVPEAQMTPPAVAADGGAYSAEQHGNQIGASSGVVQMLDSRSIPPPFDPIGQMAELYSDIAIQCREESHPPPVELPSGNMMGGLASFGNGTFDVAPVELPVHIAPVERQDGGRQKEQKVLVVEGQHSAGHLHGQKVRPPSQQQLSQPQQTFAQHQHPNQHALGEPSQLQIGSTEPAPPSQKTDNTTADSGQPSAYQAFVPGKHGAASEGANRISISGMSGGHSFSQSQERELGLPGKDISVTGGSQSQTDRANVPSALQPHRPQDTPATQYAAMHEQVPSSHPLMPGSGARHESISEPSSNQHWGTGKTEPGLAHHPSILKPAPLRSSSQPLAPSTAQPQQSRPFSAYRPAHSGEIADEQLHSAASQQSQASPPLVQSDTPTNVLAESRHDEEPRTGVTRTNTLPVDLPSLPFMGDSRSQVLRPTSTAAVLEQQQPADAQVQPAADKIVSAQSPKPTCPAEMEAQIRETILHVEHHVVVGGTSFNPESPDAPPPLSLGRKTPRPGPQPSALHPLGSSRPLRSADSTEYLEAKVQPLDVPVMSANFANTGYSNPKPTSPAGPETGRAHESQESFHEQGQTESLHGKPQEQDQALYDDPGRPQKSSAPQMGAVQAVQIEPASPTPATQQLGTINEASVTIESRPLPLSTTGLGFDTSSQYQESTQSQGAPPRPAKITAAEETSAAFVTDGPLDTVHTGGSQPPASTSVGDSAHSKPAGQTMAVHPPVETTSASVLTQEPTQEMSGIPHRPSYPASLHQSGSTVSQISSVSGGTISATAPSPMTLPGSPQPTTSSSQHRPSLAGTLPSSNELHPAPSPQSSTRPQSVHSTHSAHSAHSTHSFHSQTTPPGSANPHRPSLSGASFGSGFGAFAGRPTPPPAQSGPTSASQKPPSPVMHRPSPVTSAAAMPGAQTGPVSQPHVHGQQPILAPSGSIPQGASLYQQQQLPFLQQNAGQRPPSQASTATQGSMHSNTATNPALQHHDMQRPPSQAPIQNHPYPPLQSNAGFSQQGQTPLHRPQSTYGNTPGPQQHQQQPGVPVPHPPVLTQQQTTQNSNGPVPQAPQGPGQMHHLPLGRPPPGAILVDPNKPLPPGYVLVGGPQQPPSMQRPPAGPPAMSVQAGPISGGSMAGFQTVGPPVQSGGPLPGSIGPFPVAPGPVLQQGQQQPIQVLGHHQDAPTPSMPGQMLPPPSQQGMALQGQAQHQMFPPNHPQGPPHNGSAQNAAQQQNMLPQPQKPPVRPNGGQTGQPNPPPVPPQGHFPQQSGVQQPQNANMQGLQTLHGVSQGHQPHPSQLSGAPWQHQPQQPTQPHPSKLHSPHMPHMDPLAALGQHMSVQQLGPQQPGQQQAGHQQYHSSQPGLPGLPQASSMPITSQPIPTQYSAQQHVGPPQSGQQHGQQQHGQLGQQQQQQQPATPGQVSQITHPAQQLGHPASTPIQVGATSQPTHQTHIAGQGMSEHQMHPPQSHFEAMQGQQSTGQQNQTNQLQEHQPVHQQQAQGPALQQRPPTSSLAPPGTQTIVNTQQNSQIVYQNQQQVNVSAPLSVQPDGQVVHQQQQVDQTSSTASAETPTSGKNGWLNKTSNFFKKDAVKKIGFAVGGAVVAESLGVSGTAGAKIGSKIFDTTRPSTTQPQVQKPPPHKVQVQGQQRPPVHQQQQQQQRPHLNHVQTAPAQMQGKPQLQGQVQMHGQVQVQGQVQIGVGQPQLQPGPQNPSGQPVRPPQQQLHPGQQQQRPPGQGVQRPPVGPGGPSPQSQGAQQVDVGLQILDAVLNRPPGPSGQQAPQGINYGPPPQRLLQQQQQQGDNTTINISVGDTTPGYVYAPGPHTEYYSDADVNVTVNMDVNTGGGGYTQGYAQGQGLEADTFVINNTTYVDNNYMQETNYNQDTTFVQDYTYDQNTTYNQDTTYNQGITYGQDTTYVEDTVYVQEEAYVETEVSYDGAGWGDYDEE